MCDFGPSVSTEYCGNSPRTLVLHKTLIFTERFKYIHVNLYTSCKNSCKNSRKGNPRASAYSKFFRHSWSNWYIFFKYLFRTELMRAMCTRYESNEPKKTENCDSRRFYLIILGLSCVASFALVEYLSVVWTPRPVSPRSLAAPPSRSYFSSLLHTRHRRSDSEWVNITLWLIPAFCPLRFHALRGAALFSKLSPLYFGGNSSPEASDLPERLNMNFCRRRVWLRQGGRCNSV